jgi:hypothetical protein
VLTSLGAADDIPGLDDHRAPCPATRARRERHGNQLEVSPASIPARRRELRLGE